MSVVSLTHPRCHIWSMRLFLLVRSRLRSISGSLREAKSLDSRPRSRAHFAPFTQREEKKLQNVRERPICKDRVTHTTSFHPQYDEVDGMTGAHCITPILDRVIPSCETFQSAGTFSGKRSNINCVSNLVIRAGERPALFSLKRYPPIESKRRKGNI